jgi:hypothetical protein
MADRRFPMPIASRWLPTVSRCARRGFAKRHDRGQLVGFFEQRFDLSLPEQLMSNDQVKPEGTLIGSRQSPIQLRPECLSRH